MKKILIISNMYPSKRYPHYGIFVKHCADILAEAGNKVHVIALSKKDSRMRKLLSYGNFYLRTVIHGIFGQYDIIYAHYASHTSLPLLLIKRIKKKCIIIMNVHGNDIVPECSAEEKNTERSRRILQICDRVISPSDYYKSILIKDYQIAPQKVTVYPSGGVDVEMFRKVDRTKALSYLALDAGYRYIGYVSRIEEKKGWDIFLNACAPIVKEHPDIRLIVVGDGAQKAEYNALVKRLDLGSRVIYRPLMSQMELVYVYNVLELFVFPTYRKSESLGLVGLEAMACECTVLASDQYGPASYIHNGINGWQFVTGDYLDAEKEIENILFTHRDLKEIKKRARDTAKQYSTEQTKRILIDVFEASGRICLEEK